MKRFKLGFGNRTILEQIAICRRVADGIARLPAERRETVAEFPVAAGVAEAEEAFVEVESLKTALKAARCRRDAKVAAMRALTTRAGGDAGVETGRPQRPPNLHRDRLEEWGQMLVPRGRQQRPRPRSVEPAGQRAGEIILATDTHGF
jgi:hypothetical protein